MFRRCGDGLAVDNFLLSRNVDPSGANRLVTGLLIAALLAPLAVLSGCKKEAVAASQAKPPEVTVSQPIVREAAQFLSFTGRTKAVESVEVKARVSGYLDSIEFVDGAKVNAGDVLFRIDPRPYQTSLDQAKGSEQEAKAALVKAEADLGRAQQLLPTRAISREEYDQKVAAQGVAAASLQSAAAAIERAQLDLDFTEIRSPIAGRISKTNVTKGNLISALDGATLTTIVSIDPVYVEFDADERSILTVKTARAKEGLHLGSGNVIDEKIPIEVGLVTDEGYPHPGILEFVDNQVDPSTGTMHLRGKVSNPENPLLPGLFVRVRVQIGAPRPMTFVAERALGIDQGQRFVYVVNQENKAQYRAVEAGEASGGLRQITSSLPADAWVIVNGVQRVRPGIEVTPIKAEMADFATGSAAAQPPATTSQSQEK